MNVQSLWFAVLLILPLHCTVAFSAEEGSTEDEDPFLCDPPSAGDMERWLGSGWETLGDGSYYWTPNTRECEDPENVVWEYEFCDGWLCRYRPWPDQQDPFRWGIAVGRIVAPWQIPDTSVRFSFTKFSSVITSYGYTGGGSDYPTDPY